MKNFNNTNFINSEDKAESELYKKKFETDHS